jgi:hypothetical protein
METLESRNLLSVTNQLLAISYYHDVLGRVASSAEVTNWSQALDAGASATAVAGAFVVSPEYAVRLVSMYFQTYLQRQVDASGKASFTGALAQGSLTPEGVQALILGSDEYYGKA